MSPLYEMYGDFNTISLVGHIGDVLPKPRSLAVEVNANGADLSNFDDDDSVTDDGSLFDIPPQTQSTQSQYSLLTSFPALSVFPSVAIYQPKSIQKPLTLSTSSTIAEPTCFCCHDSIVSKNHIETDCGHTFDSECFELIIRLALQELSLPSCCGQFIPTRRFLQHISAKSKREFLAKEMEMMTDPQERLYCASSRCLAFIGAIEHDQLTSICTRCSTELCTRCRREAHTSLIACRPSQDDAEIISVGQREGWQRCYSCRAMVELTEGCNHMKCRCSAEFCYSCGKQWKPRTCSCPHMRDVEPFIVS